MKFAGRQIQGPNIEILVIPRPDITQPAKDGEGNLIYEMNGDNKPRLDSNGIPIPIMETIPGDIVFKCQAVLSYDEFEAILPEPKPGNIWIRGEKTPKPDFDDPKYLDVVNKWADRKTDWMILKSLEASEDLVWETIDMNKPETWANYKIELKSAGFTEIEIIRIVNTCASANALNQGKFDEAKKRFLHTQGKVRQN